MLSYTTMSVVDTLFVSRLGTDPLAAVGLANILVFLPEFRCWTRERCAGPDPQAVPRSTIGEALCLARIVDGAALGLAMAGLNCSQHLHRWGHRWCRPLHRMEYVLVLGAPLVLTNIALSAWFQGRGDTKTPMRATLWGASINIGLDPILIFGLLGAPALGIAGAATATVVSLFVQVLCLGIKIRSQIRGVDYSIDFQLCKSVGISEHLGVRYMLNMAARCLFVHHQWWAPRIFAAHIIVVASAPSVSSGPRHRRSRRRDCWPVCGCKTKESCRPVVLSAIKLSASIMVSWGLVFVAIPALLIAPLVQSLLWQRRPKTALCCRSSSFDAGHVDCGRPQWGRRRGGSPSPLSHVVVYKSQPDILAHSSWDSVPWGPGSASPSNC